CHLALSQSADSRDLHSFPTRRSSDLRRGRVYPFPSPLHHTALFGGRVTASPARSSSSAGQLVSRTEPGRRIVTGDDEKFTVQTNASPRRNANTSSGASHHANSSAGSPRRCRNASRYNDRVDPGSDCWASTVSAAQSRGCGSHAGPPKPNGGSVPDHGSGTRHPSRPRSVYPERFHVGSANTSSGRSVTSGRPSSSPWYT